MDNYAIGMELYRELMASYEGDIAKATAYITNAIDGAMQRPGENTGAYSREAFLICLHHLHAIIVEQYMIEHGYRRPEGSGRNIWEETPKK